jgi:hypothetical protein
MRDPFSSGFNLLSSGQSGEGVGAMAREPAIPRDARLGDRHVSVPAIRACGCGREFSLARRSSFGVWGGDLLCRRCLRLAHEAAELMDPRPTTATTERAPGVREE